MRRALFPLLCLLPAACGESEDARTRDAALIAADPVIARALHDPVMSDPDLASRNEANALLGGADSSALPVFAATPEASRAAREAARIELLEAGPIPDLPLPRSEARGTSLGPTASAVELLAALGAPATCAARLEENFALAATLPPAAALPPLAMVVQAGGAAGGGCDLRIIRYHSAAAPEDVLQYHYARALRAGLSAERYAAPEDLIAASGAKGETLVVQLREGVHGLTAVDLLYRAPTRP
jgi:hypothetical protein